MNSFFISRKSDHAVRWQTSHRVEKRLAKRATDEAPSVGRESLEDEMKKSIGDNMIPKGWSFEQGLELVKKAGFDGIELWLGDVPWFQISTTDAEVQELRRKVENAGLVVSNVSTGLHWQSPISARDPKVREQGIRIVERQIETAQLLGTDAVLLVAGPPPQGGPYHQGYLRRVGRLKHLAPQGRKAPLQIR